jgi:hypothetical protein
MRQKDKPWIALGMSRATWYRQGKPTEKPYRVTQKQRALIFQTSVRGIQRAARVIRLAPELEPLLRAGELSLGDAEQLAILGTRADRLAFLRDINDQLQQQSAELAQAVTAALKAS